jgi:3-phosphoshikimate 1-carboxyvinyltransferase
MADLFLEPLPSPPASVRVSVPRDKSIAHRLALFAALARGESFLEDYPRGEDNLTTLEVIASLGAEVEDREGGVTIRGFGRNPREPIQVLDCRNSGTTVRLAMGICGGFPISACFTGDSSLIRRPMGRVTSPLRRMGVQVLGRKGGEHLPLALAGPARSPYQGEIPRASAQVKSAILLCGLTSGCPVEIEEPLPTRNHTEQILRWLGYPVELSGRRIILKADLFHEGFRSAIPRDPSQAAFFSALFAIRGGRVTFPELLLNPGRLVFFRWLERMGVRVKIEPHPGERYPEPVAEVTVEGRVERGIEIPAEEIPLGIDELPLFALFGLLLPEGILLRHAEELRYKESDRISAIAQVARALGGEVEEYPDGVRVKQGNSRPERAFVDSAGDHRIAMASAIFALGLGIPLYLKDAEAVRISYPGFYEELHRLGCAEPRWVTP